MATLFLCFSFSFSWLYPVSQRVEEKPPRCSESAEERMNGGAVEREGREERAQDRLLDSVIGHHRITRCPELETRRCATVNETEADGDYCQR
jgi:hypothetical protein